VLAATGAVFALITGDLWFALALGVASGLLIAFKALTEPRPFA
jgi:hypothetical protein